MKLRHAHRLPTWAERGQFCASLLSDASYMDGEWRTESNQEVGDADLMPACLQMLLVLPGMGLGSLSLPGLGLWCIYMGLGDNK